VPRFYDNLFEPHDSAAGVLPMDMLDRWHRAFLKDSENLPYRKLE